MAITAANVKELREKTGAGMMDCKKALGETNGDMEAAVDWLRTKGIAKADKKAGRVAAEGLVAMAAKPQTGVLVEVNSETDFVSRNDGFQAVVGEIAELGLTVDSSEGLASATLPSTGKSVTDSMKDLVGKIGENMNFRRLERLDVKEGTVTGYIHNAVAPGMGKIGVLVALESAGDANKLDELAKKIAMHVAATNPLALSEADLDQDVVAKEREMLKAEALESGKPEAIVDKMVDGRMQKFFKESVLLTQVFVMDGENTIKQVVENAAKDMGMAVELTGYKRVELGEGIEKVEEDFAAEVAKTASGG